MTLGSQPVGRRLTVVQVAPFYWPAVGGAELHLKRLSEGLVERGHDVTVVTQKHTGVTGRAMPSLPTVEMVNGVRVHRLREWRWPSAAAAALFRIPGSWRALSRLLGDRRLRATLEGALMPQAWWHALRLRPDVITYVNYTFPAIAYAFLAASRRRRYPFVGLPLLHLEEPWSRSAVTRDLLLRSSALLLNTEFERRHLESIGYPADRAHVVGPGVDPGDFAERDGARLRAAHGIGAAPVVGYVGRLAPNKGVVTLIEAMRLVWRTTPEARLLLVGRRFPSGSPQDRAVQAALGGLPPEQRERVVQLDGFAERDKASIFEAIDVLAMPSTSESFGIAFLEAWMCGKPVVGARIGAVECVIAEGIDGLLAAPHDPAATAAAIERLLASPALRSRLGAAGRAKTLSRFTWDRIIDQVEDIYRTLVAARTGVEGALSGWADGARDGGQREATSGAERAGPMPP